MVNVNEINRIETKQRLNQVVNTGVPGFIERDNKPPMVKDDDSEGRIRILNLRSALDAVSECIVHVRLHGWTGQPTITWAHAGRGWYVSNSMVRSTGSFLYVDLTGKVTVINVPESYIPGWGIPSPDGRHPVFGSSPGIANAWMIENF